MRAGRDALDVARQRKASFDPARIAELDQRLARVPLQRPRGDLLWLHSGPGSDPRALADLIARLRDERGGLSVVCTGDGESVAQHAEVLVQQTPVDSAPIAAEFLDHWHPDTCLWAGAGWQPELLGALYQRGIPVIAVDAQEDTSGPRWVRAVRHGHLDRLDHILTENAGKAARLIARGAPAGRVEAVGRLEPATVSLHCSDRDWADLAEALEARPVWLAMDVAPGEMDDVIEAHRWASRLSHRLLLIVAPADPASGAALCDRLNTEGWQAMLLSRDAEPAQSTQVFVVDRSDKPGLFYRIAPLTFMGQTLDGSGPGRSPMEPALLGSVIVHGPHISGHAELYRRLERAGAASTVERPDALGRAVERLLAPDKAAELAHAAWQEVTAGAEAADRAFVLLDAALDHRAGRA